MTDSVGTRKVEVSYRNAEPQMITLRAYHRDGEYQRGTEYTFRMKGATAVLSGLTPDDDSYQVRLADDERAAVKDTVAALPFVQAVAMFPEVEV